MDDYGISVNAVRETIQLIRQEALSSVSFMVNMAESEVCAAMPLPYKRKIVTSVHLNVLEGRCSSKAEDIGLMVNGNGNFKLSWLKILMKSKNKEFRSQLKKEFCSEIDRYCQLLGLNEGGEPLRLDSYQHVHMIPRVFCILCELAESGKYRIEYNHRMKSKGKYITFEEILLMLLIVQLSMLVLANIIKVTDCLNHDASTAICHGVEIWRNWDLFLPDFVSSSTLELDCASFFAAPLYLVSGNLGLSLALIHICTGGFLLAALLLFTPHRQGELQYINMLFFSADQYEIRLICLLCLFYLTTYCGSRMCKKYITVAIITALVFSYRVIRGCLCYGSNLNAVSSI